MAGTSPDPGLSLDCLNEEALRSLLNGGENRDFENHLESCQTCRVHLQSLAGGEIEAQPLTEISRSAALERAMTSLKTSTFASSTHVGEWLEPSVDENLLGLLGPYEVRRILAEGGMGLVLEARDPLLDRDVAIKLIKPQQVGSDLARERMLREARAVAAIEHESVVPIYAAEVSKKTGAVFIVMPLVTGGNLQDRLDTKFASFSNDEITSIASQIAAGLAAVHARGILHRDIKPANILMREDEKIWLADFGIARTNDDQRLTGTGDLPGTPQFMSPEQVNSKECDARSDLFSFGAVLYHLATGEPAFSENTALKTARAIADRPHRPVASLNSNRPTWLSRLIDDLLEKDPSKRPQSAEEVVTRLTSHETKNQTTRDNRSQRILIASLIGIILVAAAWFTFRTSNPEPDSQPAPQTWALENFTNSRAETGYDTLAKAIAAASPGDSIEVRIEGLINCNSLPTITKALILRAAEGFEPTLTSDNSNKPLIHHTAPLVLEGLRFRHQARGSSPPPVIRSEEALSVAHCSFSRDSQALRPGARPHAGIITSIGSSRIEIINSAIAAAGSNAITLTSGTQELHLKNVLIATPVGVYFRHSESEKVNVHIERSSFHGKGLAAWDPSQGNRVAPVDFKLHRSAIETNMGVFGIPATNLNSVKAAVSFAGFENLYSPGTPFLLLAPPATQEQIATLEEWQKIWTLGDKNSLHCEMDLTRRIRANRHRRGPDGLDFRPSAKAAQKYPERGFDPETAGLGEKYHRFRKTEAYQAWIKQATSGWQTLSEKK